MGGCCHTLSREAGRAVIIIRSKENETDMTYQSVAGTLSPGGHPGSYNGQDAYNDMLVTDDGCSMYGERAASPNHNEANSKLAGLYARRADHSGGGGV